MQYMKLVEMLRVYSQACEIHCQGEEQERSETGREFPWSSSKWQMSQHEAEALLQNANKRVNV